MRLLLLIAIVARLVLCLEHDGTYASSTGHTSTYDCSLNEYYKNECALILNGSRGALAASPTSVAHRLELDLEL